MNDTDRIQQNQTLAILARLERRLARLERLLDEGIGAYLNAKFPYGKPTDRWRSRA